MCWVPVKNMLSEFMKEMFIAEKAYNIDMAEIAMTESVINAQLQINLARSEVRVMMESADVSDLFFLVEEAANDANEQKENIFLRMFRSIGNFFVTVANSIQKLFTGKNLEAYNNILKKKGKVAIPKGINQVLEDVEGALNKTEQVISSNGKDIAKIIAAVAAAITASGGAFAFYNKSRKSAETEEVPATKGKSILDRAKELVSRIGKAFVEFGNLKKGDNSANSGNPIPHVEGEVVEPAPSRKISGVRGPAIKGISQPLLPSAKKESTKLLPTKDSSASGGGDKSDDDFSKIRKFLNDIKKVIDWIVSSITKAIFGGSSSVEESEEPATESVSMDNDDIDPIDAMLAGILV